MNGLVRDVERLFSALEQLTSARTAEESLQAYLARGVATLHSLMAAEQVQLTLVSAEGEILHTHSGHDPAACQTRWLEGRARDAGPAGQVELLRRDRWEEGPEVQRCLDGHLRSGALISLPCADCTGVLLVAFRTDHLFSDCELAFLRTVANVFGTAVKEGLDAGRTNRRGGLPALAERIDAQEAERKRIAAELHDAVGQSLSALKYGIESCLLQHQKSGGQVKRKGLEALLRHSQAALDEARRVAAGLHPPMLEDFGLVTTLEWFCREFQGLWRPLQVRLSIAVREEEIPAELRIAIYRICQEAMNNVAKHASAAIADVSLVKESGSLVLRITDDGAGLSDGGGGSGMGISGMRERAASSGGALTIGSLIGGGTLVEGSWPLRRRTSAMRRPGPFHVPVARLEPDGQASRSVK